jgi:hypothetical protein
MVFSPQELSSSKLVRATCNLAHSPFSTSNPCLSNALASLPPLHDHHHPASKYTSASSPCPCPVCDAPSTHSCLDCDQSFCGTHIYSCADCATEYCGNCLDAHRSDGHWSDSDTAAELAHARRIHSGPLYDHHGPRPARHSTRLRPSDLRPELTHNPQLHHRPARRSSWTAFLAALRSFLFFPRPTAVHAGACA